MTPTLLLLVYAGLIVAASIAGGLVPSLLRLGHRSLQFVLSFVAGVMLGVALFHMLPHAIMLRAERGGGVGHSMLDPIMLWVVAGFLVLFLLARFSHFHQHEVLPDAAAGDAMDADGDQGHGHHHHHEHGECAHGKERQLDHHHHDHQDCRAASSSGGSGHSGWVGALVGLGVHSLLEGIALAASVVVGASHGGEAGMALAGLATFLVILLHKPFDAMTLAMLMRRAGLPFRTRLLGNLLLALLVPAGVGLFWAGAAESQVSTIAVAALAFSAGTFLCIATSDLLPELQFHRHDRVGLSIALIIGLAFAFGLARLEASTHVHVDGGHEHHDHDHDHDHAH